MMAGLFDLLTSKDPMVANGLLQMGLSLLNSRGNFGNALGQAGMVGLYGANRYKEQQLWQKMQQAQLDRAQREKVLQGRDDALANLPGQYIVPPSQPGVDATGGMETALEAPQNQASSMGRMDLPGLSQAFMRTPGGLQSGLALQQALQKQAPQIHTNKPGDVSWVMTPTGPKKVMEVPSTGGEGPSAVQEYEYAKKQGYKGTFEQWKALNKPAGASVHVGLQTPMAMTDPATGKIVMVQPTNKPGAPPQVLIDPASGKPFGPPSDKKSDLTEAQAKATAYLGQMRSASKALEAIGADQTVLSVQAETALAGGPINAVIGQKAQRIRQAQEQWSEAFLRFKTGAASTKDEVAANRKTFFPTLGDTPEVVKQKKIARAQAEADMEIASGRGTGQLNARDGVGSQATDPLGIR
jgi:hypothetical protein